MSRTTDKTLELPDFAATVDPSEAPHDHDAPRPLASTPGGDLTRYEDWGLLGSGGMGEVRRVYDRRLGIVVAMKLLRADRATSTSAQQRFLAEAATTARLQHPGIVPVHDRGAHPERGLWYTMRKVSGQTLSTVAHQTRSGGLDELGTRRLVGLMLRASEAVAYAHSNRVIHRDLKPDNIMVGAFGEVLVLDWGLARSQDLPDWADTPSGPSGEGLTRTGQAMGTPGFMPPEQALGDLQAMGPQSDVFALGVTLHVLLTGSKPNRPGGDWRLAPTLDDLHDDELGRLMARCMAAKPTDRLHDAGQVANRLSEWLDGARRTAEARATYERAMALRPHIDELRTQAEDAERQAKLLRVDLRPWSSVDDKRPLWTLEDRIVALERHATVQETAWQQGIRGALDLSSYPPALAALADYHRARMDQALRLNRTDDAARYEVLLRSSDRAGSHARYLAGLGLLTLHTSPSGAEVFASRFVEQDRRSVEQPIGSLGTTPLDNVELQHGSYLLRIQSGGMTEARYPVHIHRDGHWSGVSPGTTTPWPVQLLTDNTVNDNQIYVPGGWFAAGGDPLAVEPVPDRQVWVDGFVVQRTPVTMGEYLRFLNALVERDQRDEAWARAPRESSSPDAPRKVSWRGGQLALSGHDSARRPWQPTWPITMISWRDATAYAAWLHTCTGHAWRLPCELEWEKAARGVDGRCFAWGSTFDPTFANVLNSRAGTSTIEQVGTSAWDVSVYGMQDATGNIRELCADTWRDDGPPIVDGRLVIHHVEDGPLVLVRGGGYGSNELGTRLAGRSVTNPDFVNPQRGFRLVFTATGSSPHPPPTSDGSTPP